MGSYLIKVDGVTKDAAHSDFDEAMVEGVACDGFAIIARVDDGYKVIMHATGIDDLATAISKSDELLAAATVAKARKEADEILAKAKMRSMLNGGSLADMFRNMHDD